jgi:hypothetical protein
MKYVVAVVIVLGLTGCTPAQDEHAREQAHHTAEQAKHDAKEALEKAKVETQKASRELDEDLHKARDKARRALNEPDSKPER